MTRELHRAESALRQDLAAPAPGPAEAAVLAAPDAPPALQHIQSLPSWLLGRVAARGRSLVAEALAGQGVKMLHHAVLAAVSELGPIAQADLGRRLAIDPKDLVGVLNDLQADGLAVREPDPRDRRKNAVTATPAGRDLLERCATVAEAANAELLAPLTPAEARRLMALLGRLHEA
ncbi:MarR family transcriptional regulator [Streptomyces sp. ASQP_92]|uniref:MarR family winged helix-turn-helix transcriptional regulator n=1 Tax=Streptomyces sp. ASQP_92 TaxID=2979116 RepID=UPI0021C05909|nr:MarR family transcriptional regulator [Streptomyces sp. ASQP_92]MCT9090105.1 MarR family transcriptional regulator [Streptomyces sp. ASQP_92]